MPGRDETRAEAFGALRWARPVEIGGVDLESAFAGLSFAEQVGEVGRRIRSGYASAEALLLGRSFGAWILLQALMEREEAYPGTVILIASVLGYGRYRGVHFLAPRAAAFRRAVDAGTRAPARRLALIHAVDDEQCPFSEAQWVSEAWGVELVAFERGGHGLGKTNRQEEVSGVIRRVWEA